MSNISSVIAELQDGQFDSSTSAAFRSLLQTLKDRAEEHGSSKKGVITIKIGVVVSDTAVEITAEADVRAERIACADIYVVDDEGNIAHKQEKLF